MRVRAKLRHQFQLVKTRTEFDEVLDQIFEEGHRLDNHDTGENGITGKMALEHGLIEADVLVGDDRFAGVNRNDPINQQKRVAVGKYPLDQLDIRAFQRLVHVSPHFK